MINERGKAEEKRKGEIRPREKANKWEVGGRKRENAKERAKTMKSNETTSWRERYKREGTELHKHRPKKRTKERNKKNRSKKERKKENLKP